MIPERLYEYLEDLPHDVTIKVMLEALDIMQMHNGHSHTEAILNAINAEEIDGTWKLPYRDEVCRLFGNG